MKKNLKIKRSIRNWQGILCLDSNWSLASLNLHPWVISSVYKGLFITSFWQVSVIFVHAAAAFYLHLITHLLKVLRPLILVGLLSFSLWLDQNGFYFSAIILFSFPSSVTVVNITVSSPSPRLRHSAKVSFECSLLCLRIIVKYCWLSPHYKSIPSFVVKYLDFPTVSFFSPLLGSFLCYFSPFPPSKCLLPKLLITCLFLHRCSGNHNHPKLWIFNI